VKRYPNLFLVGAPKCGTTSMAYYLGQHPDIFAPVWKEPMFFGVDFTRHNTSRSETDYLSLFEKWQNERYALDASTNYFYSRTAAKEIFDSAPEARILIMVRNPINATYSMFFENRFGGVEPIARFEDALAAEEERTKRGCPPARGSLEQLLYSRIYAYTSNIYRYRSIFGPKRVTVLVLDDFKRDARKEFIKVSDMLGLDGSCANTIDFSIKNAAKGALSRRLGVFAASPPGWAGRLTGRFLSKAQRLKIRNMIAQINTIPSDNPPMNPETRRLLAQKFAPEVERLSALLDRDLTHWLQVDE